ncbi:TSCPD domain-containing protein [Roseicyclus sp.]|uniref:TSCPD domain-containing protein n=1 Tax=Roseicyclus sp. TaxID=1914329 RepID=UPI003F6C3768
MTRQQPPNRRPALTIPLKWRTELATHAFDITIGLDPVSGDAIEVFYADGQRGGSQLQHAIQDACVLISLLLQHGVQARDIAKSLSTMPVHGSPEFATVVGVIVGALQHHARENA